MSEKGIIDLTASAVEDFAREIEPSHPYGQHAAILLRQLSKNHDQWREACINHGQRANELESQIRGLQDALTAARSNFHLAMLEAENSALFYKLKGFRDNAHIALASQEAK